MNSSSKSGSHNSKCNHCSESLGKKKHYICSECCELFCKLHIRIHPENSTACCATCFSKYLIAATNFEFEAQIKACKTALFSTKEKSKLCKKEKLERVQAFERLSKLRSKNLNIHMEKIEKIRKSINEEIEYKENRTRDIGNLQISIEDSKARAEIAERKLESANEELVALSTELYVMRTENEILRKQSYEYNEEYKKYIPYERLRNLACENCRNKLKKNFRHEIQNGKFSKYSIVASVLAYRGSLATQGSINKKRNPNSDKADDKPCCVVI